MLSLVWPWHFHDSAQTPEALPHARADALSVVVLRGVHRGDPEGPDAEPVLAAERLARAADAAIARQAPALLNPWPQGSHCTTIDITNIYSNSASGEGARVRCFPPNVYS